METVYRFFRNVSQLHPTIRRHISEESILRLIVTFVNYGIAAETPCRTPYGASSDTGGVNFTTKQNVVANVTLGIISKLPFQGLCFPACDNPE
jgi:hypothetical protein